MIKKIRLQNWKTHLDSTFEFVKGTNVIVGKMGSGKSSVMDGISFALYGTFPAREARRVSAEETIMAKPFKQEKATVRLVFEYSGKEYEVERTVKRSGMSEAYLRKAGNIIAGPKMTETTKKVEEVLEVPYDLFSRAIYSEQNQVDYFLKLSAAQRKEKLDELLGLDRYESVRSNCMMLSNRLKKMTDDRKVFLAEQRGKIDARALAEYESRVKEKRAFLVEKSAELVRLENEGREAKARLESEQAKEKETKKLREMEITAKSRHESLLEQIARQKQKLKQANLAKAKYGLVEVEKRLREIAVARKETASERERAEKEVTMLRESMARYKNTVETAQKGLKQVSTLGGECPVCRRPLAEHDREKLEKELNSEVRDGMARVAGLEKRVEESGKASEAFLRKAEKLEEEKEKCQETAQELKSAVEVVADVERLEKQLSEFEALEKEAHAKLASVGFDEKSLERERSAFYGISEKAGKVKSELRSGEELLRELEASAKMMRDAEERVKEIEKRVVAGEKGCEKLALFGSALRSTQAELRNVMVETINEAMDETWPGIYPYQDFTSVRIVVEEGSYEVMVRQLNGEWVRVDGVLSGGERNAVALTVRIATSLVLTQNLGWIILDEPTHNLDANSVKELALMVGNRLPGLISQIFVITHDKEMENAASGKLYALEREKEKDGVTVVLGE